MKKISTILMILTLFLFVGCATLSSVKGRENFAEEHNMTVVMNTEQIFYAVREDQLFEQKPYIIYYKYKPYTDVDVALWCYYVDGEFYSEIKSKITNLLTADGNSGGGDFINITLRNETAYLLNSSDGSYHITAHGYRSYTAMLKYYRAILLVDFSRDFGIFIPDDKKKEYQLDDIDKLEQEFYFFY